MLSNLNLCFKSRHTVILTTLYLSVQLLTGIPFRMGSILYPDVVQLFSHDYEGNIVLNAKLNGRKVFEINFAPDVIPYGNKVQIKFCRTGSTPACGQNQGLVICWERNGAENPFEKNTPEDPRMRHLMDTCKGMQGVMLTTEMHNTTDSTDEIFRLDTVYGSTYRFDHSSSNCFKLNLFGFQHFPGTNQMFKDEKAWKEGRQKRSAGFAWKSDSRARSGLSRTDTSDGNKIGLDKPVDDRERFGDIDGNTIMMKDEELKMWAYTRPWYHLVKFKVQGGGPCCGLSAKILGRSISKCYFAWNRLIQCRAMDNDGKTNTCPYDYQVGVSPKAEYGEEPGCTLCQEYYDKEKYEKMLGAYLAANFTDFYPLLKENILANLSQMVLMNDKKPQPNLIGALYAMQNQLYGNNNGSKETWHATGASAAHAERGPDYANGYDIPYTTYARQLVFRCFGLEVETDATDHQFDNALVLKDIDDWLEKNGYPVPGRYDSHVPEPKCEVGNLKNN